MKFKKPKFWDKKHPNLISYILFPLTFLLEANNFLLKFKSKKKIKIKTICIGNIYLGGTGKTPTTIKIYEILKEMKFNIVVGKKFYASHLDEQKLLQKKTNLIQDKEREKIIKEAIKNGYDTLVFDDGLQDQKVVYDLNLVCFDSQNFIGNGLLIPSGPLREKLNSLKKYDVVIFKDSNDNLKNYINIIKKINPNIKVFQSYLKIKNIKDFNLNKDYIIFSGIGNSKSFKETLINNKFNIIKEINFPDHYQYKKVDLIKIINEAKKINADILTTEKDFMKISEYNLNSIHSINVDLVIEKENILREILKNKLNEKS